MLVKSVPPTRRFRLFPWSWTAVAVALLAIQAALSVIVRKGGILTAYSMITYFVVLVLAAGIATLNAAQNRQTIRLFWSFLAMAFGVWSLSAWSWIYYVLGLGRNHPVYLFVSVPLFLRIVLMIAAAVSRPDLKLSRQRGYRTTLNFLLLLFFWVFAYALLRYPSSYLLDADAPLMLRGPALYLAANLLLLVVLGVLILRVRPPWKSIYWHLFGASALYAVGSLTANIVLVFRGYSAGLKDIPYTAAAYWFVWVALRGRKLAPQLAQSVQPDTRDTKYASLVAMLSVVAVPVVGVWELLRVDEPYRTHVIRLLIILVSIFFLAGVAFAKEYLANRELASDVGLAREEYRRIVETANEGVWLLDSKLHTSYVNRQMAEMLGYEPGEMLGRSVFDFYFSEDVEHKKQVLKRRQQGLREEIEERLRRRDGAELWVRMAAIPICKDNGEFDGAMAMVSDITDRRLAEEAVRESEQRFRLIANSAPVMIWMSGTDKLCTYFNKPWLDFTGRSMDSELGNGWAEGVHPEDLAKCLDTYTQAFDRRAEFRMEYRLRRHDGEYRWVLDIGVPRFNQDRSFVGYIGIGIDVTERKLAEERLREYEKAVEGTEEMIAVVDGEYRYLIANRKFLSLRNMTKEQVVGRLAPEVLTKAVFEAVVKEKLDECFRGKVVRYEMKYTYPELGERDIFISYFPIEGATGVDRVACIMQDITERKRAEEALQKSEERFRLAAHAGKMFAYEWDAATDVIVRSAESAQILGVDEATLTTGKQILTNVHPDDRERLKTAVAELSSEKPYLQISYRIVRPDGNVIWVERNSRAHFDEQGRMLRIIGMVADITERKQTEVALKKSEEKFSKAFQQSPMALTLSSPNDYRYIEINETFERITGWRRDEVIGRTAFDLGLWVNPAQRVEAVKRVLAEGSLRNLEFRFFVRDGSIRIGRASAELIELDGQPCVLAVIADITEHKHAEEALRESEDKLRLLLDSTAEAIYGIDLEGRCTFCNPACLRILGYERIDELLGKNMHALIHHSRADGTLFSVEECRVHEVVRTGEGIHVDDEVLWRANGTSFPAEYWAYPQRRGQEVLGAVVAFIDITQRKMAEEALSSVSRRLIEAQEQERTRIARELHDDIVQRLALLAIELEQLPQSSPDLPSGVRNRVSKLRKQTSEIATDTQSLSHELHSSKLEYLGIAAAMRGFCQEFGAQQKVEIDFKTHDLPSPLSPDISLCLFRVLQEALHNSAKHSGVRHFEVRLWGTTEEVYLTVSDSGGGFDPEAAKESRGLGLISMEERLKLLKGRFSIESQPNRGTTIHARVPLSSGSDSMRAAG